MSLQHFHFTTLLKARKVPSNLPPGVRRVGVSAHLQRHWLLSAHRLISLAREDVLSSIRDTRDKFRSLQRAGGRSRARGGTLRGARRERRAVTPGGGHQTHLRAGFRSPGGLGVFFLTCEWRVYLFYFIYLFLLLEETEVLSAAHRG